MMQQPLLRLAVMLACLWGAWQWWSQRPVMPKSGVLVAQEPEQDTYPQAQPAGRIGQNSLKALASFDLKARLLLKEPYRFDRGAELAPMDLAVGWGELSDSQVLERLNYSQGGRFLWWTWDANGPAIPYERIKVQSANLHIIPANDSVRRTLERLRIGQLLQLRGQLVEVQGDDGFLWRSSLRRDDDGNGACELVLVDKLEILPTP